MIVEFSKDEIERIVSILTYDHWHITNEIIEKIEKVLYQKDQPEKFCLIDKKHLQQVSL
jgi:hypothetical protein